jgi:hypothetical protein
VSISNASELEVTEWVIQDEPGVYITVRELADGTRELRRVRFRSCVPTALPFTFSNYLSNYSLIFFSLVATLLPPFKKKKIIPGFLTVISE